ncbi:MAG TPA: hypothetical protein VJP58_04485, partial [Candidatus Nitrosocosmicus sp.]|nr:hypothetical protein [Candidatus Nitrosocosmicus sp.]
PSSSTSSFLSQLKEFLQRLSTYKNADICILGDFNIDLLKYLSHDPSSEFLNLMLSFGLTPTISKPTRITKESKTLIDNIFTNINTSLCKSSIIYNDISDHLSIILQINASKYSLTESNTDLGLNDFREYSSYQVNNFCEFLSNCDWAGIHNCLATNNPDLAYDEFLKIFQFGFEKCFPLKQYRKPAAINKSKSKLIWITKGLEKSCSTKAKLYKTYMKNQTTENKDKYIKYRNSLKTLLIKAEYNYYTNKINNCEGNPKGCWKIINSLIKNTNNDSSRIEINNDQTTVTDSTQVSNEFNKYFANIAPDLANKIPESNKIFKEYMNYGDRPMPSKSCVLLPTDAQEIISIVSQLTNSSSSGHDNIPVNLL